MAKGVKTRNAKLFQEALTEYAYGRCSQSKVAKNGWHEQTNIQEVRKYAFLGIPFPDTLFKAEQK